MESSNRLTIISLLLVVAVSMSCTFSLQETKNQVDYFDNVEVIDIVSLEPSSYKTIGKGRVYDTEFSPDNKVLAVGTSVSVIFYETTKFDEIHTIHAISVEKLEWSPDGRYIAIAEASNLFIYDFITKRVIELEYGNDVLLTEQISWSPNGQYLAATALVTLYGNAWVWDVSTGKRIYDYGLDERKFSSSAYANGLGWSSNNKELAISFRVVKTNEIDEESQLVILDFSNIEKPKVKSQWSIPNYPFTREFTLPEQSTGDIYWVASDQYLVVISTNNVSLISTNNGQVIKQIVMEETILTGEIKDGKISLVIGKRSLSVQMLSIPELNKLDEVIYSGNPLCTSQQMQKFTCAFENASLSPDESIIIGSSSFSDGVFIWKSGENVIAYSIYLDSHWNEDIAFSLNSKYVATLGQDELVRSYDTDTLKIVDITQNSASLILTNNGKLTINDNKGDGTLLRLNHYRKEEIKKQSPNQTMDAYFEEEESNCSWWECGGFSVYNLIIRDIESNNTIYSVQLTGRASLELKWSPNNKWLLTNGSIGNKDYSLPFGLIIISVEPPHKIIVLTNISSERIDLSKDGNYIGTTGYDGLIHIISAETLIDILSIR